MNKTLKRLLTILLFFLLAVSAGLFIAGKFTGTNYFENIKNSVVSIFSTKNSTQANNESTPLEVKYDTTKISTLQNSVAITLKTNREVKIDETTKAKLFLSQKPNDESSDYWYVLTVYNLGVGDFNYNVDVKDEFNQSKKIIVAITRLGFTLPFGLGELPDWEGFSYTADGDQLGAQVDKGHKLPNDYAPKELVDVNKDLLLYTNSASPILVRREAGEALKVMAKALQTEKGKNLVIMSGYRTYDEQFRTYTNWVRQMGQEEADKVSARPGFSEHQLGTAMDFVDQETGLDLTNDFDKYTSGQWLRDNAYKYGFVQSYPEGKEGTTGYQHEAWHWRYVGIDIAKKVKDSGLTLKEWFDQN